jgi:putative ABC transport system substrate-binding protein
MTLEQFELPDGLTTRSYWELHTASPGPAAISPETWFDYDVTKLDAVAAAIGRAAVGALFVADGPTLLSARAEITAMVARLRLPAMYGFREFAEAGGLMSYGYNLPDAYRQSARLVDRILKGDRPGDLPFELPARYELIVNLKAAKAIGLMIPDSFVLLADEVIE